jgi:hypothetical protein
MIKRSRTKAASLAPLTLPVAALVHVTGGNPSVDVPIASMREIVHIQARK